MKEQSLRNTNTGGYKFEGVTDELSPTGNELRPVNEIEVKDLTNPQEVEKMIHYLANLDEDPDYEKLSSLKHRKLSKEEFVELLKSDPGGMYANKDGKKISMSQYMKNKKSMNTRNNYEFQTGKDGRFAEGNSNLKGKDNANYQSMVFNQKKVK